MLFYGYWYVQKIYKLKHVKQSGILFVQYKSELYHFALQIFNSFYF